jgi:hypothetical protein
MSDRPAPSRSSRQRQREAVLNGVAKLIGCVALVVTVAVVFYVTVTQLDRQSPKIDPAYLEESEAAAEHSWSGAGPQPSGHPTSLARPTPANPEPVSVGSAVEPSVMPAPAPERGPSLTDALPGPQASQSQAALQDIEKKRSKIEAALRRFFSATTVTEKAASSRDAARVAPLMEAYYQKHILSVGKWQSLGWVSPMDEPGHRLAYAQTLFTDAEPVCVIIEETDDGAVLVDWESSVRYGEQEWKDFLSKKPGQPTLFRVIASRPAADSAAQPQGQEEVIELKHPAEQGTVDAYFNRDDPQFHSLLEQLKLGNWTNVPLTLRLCYPGPTSSARAVRIASIEGKGWLILQNRRS